MTKNIETQNLNRICCDNQTLEFALAGNLELEEHLNVIVPDNWTEFGSRALKYSLDKLNSAESEKGWWSYLPIHKLDNKLIGLC